VHTQTLAAIYPDADSYEQLITVCRKLHLPESDCQEVFRRMVFNILSNNTDDHNKNFSFIMQKDGSWRLSPAYDITYIIDNGGYLPNEDHCLYIRAKLRNVTREDVIQFAHDNGIRRPDSIIRDVVGSLKQFRSVATKYGVSEQWTGRVEATIIGHMKAWGEGEEQTSALTINGHLITDFHLKQQFKGNYLLLATIDGKELKYIIRKGTPEHEELTRTGLANITEEMKKELIERFLLPKIGSDGITRGRFC
jgi:serine/threonine-protein kinase HipA